MCPPRHGCGNAVRANAVGGGEWRMKSRRARRRSWTRRASSSRASSASRAGAGRGSGATLSFATAGWHSSPSAATRKCAVIWSSRRVRGSSTPIGGHTRSRCVTACASVCVLASASRRVAALGTWVGATITTAAALARDRSPSARVTVVCGGPRVVVVLSVAVVERHVVDRQRQWMMPQSCLRWTVFRLMW